MNVQGVKSERQRKENYLANEIKPEQIIRAIIRGLKFMVSLLEKVLRGEEV